MTTDKLPPHDIGAEEAVNGSLLIDGPAFTEIMANVAVEDFYNEANRWIFQAAVSLYERSEAIDEITVAQELNRQERLEVVGGAAYLSHLISVVPTSLDIRHYAKIVQRLSISRQLIQAAERISDIGYKADPDSAKSLGDADELLMDIRKRTVGSPIVDPGTRAERLLDRYSALYQTEGGVALSTGFVDLDKRLGGGMFNGDFMLLGARPSVGKTTLLQNIANNIGDRGKNVLYCSVEMSWEGMSDRDLAGITGNPISDIRLGGYSDELFRDIVAGLDNVIVKRHVYYMDDMPMTVNKVMRAGLELQLRKGVALIIVDYLGIMSDDFGKGAYERVGYISRKIKEVARVLDVPVLAAHQLSRNLETDKTRMGNKRPQLWDLRDSGTLEEDADVVMFLYRDNYYDLDSTDVGAEVLLAKLRQGEAGKGVMLMFDRATQTYRSGARNR